MKIAALDTGDIDEIATAFAALGWNKPRKQYVQYLHEQQARKRQVLVGRHHSEFVGYVTILWRSPYAAFAEANIPEIADFNVLPHRQRRGFGSALMDEAERLAFEFNPVVGIGVGLTADYGAAQRLYSKRGYILDGHGATYDGRPLVRGDATPVDDRLLLYFTKSIG